jgi:hypothetical protein
MFEAEPHRHVKYAVGPCYRLSQRSRIENVTLDKGKALMLPRLGQKLRYAVDMLSQPITREPITSRRSTGMLAMNPAAPVTKAVESGRCAVIGA